MNNVSTPIKLTQLRKKLSNGSLELVRAKVLRESTNLYKSDTQTVVNVTNSAPSARYTRAKSEYPFGNRTSPLRRNDELPELEWEHPDLVKVEKRTVNKELETKRVLLNLIMVLCSRLVFDFGELFMKKLEIQFDVVLNPKHILLTLQLLFLWNIAYGIYKITKPQDQFTDLSLNQSQRDLLGLPRPVGTNVQAESEPHVIPSIVNPKSEKPSLLESSISNKKVKDHEQAPQPKPKAHTPISSPRASIAASSFSPRKPVSSKKTTVSLENAAKDRVTALKQSELSSTPTYIPSPKYYYRMDSPSRTRRRV